MNESWNSALKETWGEPSGLFSSFGNLSSAYIMQHPLCHISIHRRWPFADLLFAVNLSVAVFTTCFFNDSDFVTAGGEQDHPVMLRIRAMLIKIAGAMELPANPLDQLVELLGGTDKVAEMTGRKGQLIRQSEGVVKYQHRREGVKLGPIILLSKSSDHQEIDLSQSLYQFRHCKHSLGEDEHQVFWLKMDSVRMA